MPIPIGMNGHDNWLVGVADGLNAKVVEPVVLQYYRRHESNASQFIANRTEKLTRNLLLRQSFQNLLTQKAVDHIRKQLEQSIIFADELARVKVYASESYGASLDLLEKRYRLQISVLEQRLGAVDKPFLPRIASVGRLMVNGAYCTPNGCRTILKDICG